MQYIDVENKITILEYLVSYLKQSEVIDRIILAVPQNEENSVFKRVAHKNGWEISFGDEVDMLGRMLDAAKAFSTEIIFQGSTESPFLFNLGLDSHIREHIKSDFDYTHVASIPEGAGYAIYKTEALARSHKFGNARHRSELVSSYIFDHQEEFKIRKIIPDTFLQRPEVRVTVDYPEDLVFCRQVYQAMSGEKKLIEIADIIDFWDKHPNIRKPMEDIGIDWGHGRLWD